MRERHGPGGITAFGRFRVYLAAALAYLAAARGLGDMAWGKLPRRARALPTKVRAWSF
jgi:hypothetical protein